jgi:hypothetical protein
MSFRNYPVQNRGERGLLPTCGSFIVLAVRDSDYADLQVPDVLAVVRCLAEALQVITGLIKSVRFVREEYGSGYLFKNLPVYVF